MSDIERRDNEEIHSKVLRAGRRTYFFDVRSTKADDYYLTITESKKHTNENGNVFYKKHKIYLYKEDFENFKELLGEVTDYIVKERGEEVISETHQPDFHKKPVDEEYAPQNEEGNKKKEEPMESSSAKAFTDVSFDDI